MKTLFNKNFLKKMIISFLVAIIFMVSGVLILRKTQQFEKEKKFSQKITIDNATDLRTLGYTGQRKIAQDSNGNIFVSYRKDYQKNSEIFVTQISQNEKGFDVFDTDKPIAVVDKNNDQRVPSIAIDVRDMIHVVWYGSDVLNTKNNRQVKYARKSASASNWESWRNIAYVNGYDGGEYWQEHPMILSGKDDVLYVVWEGRDEENVKQQIKFSKSINGGTVWTKWKNVLPMKNNTQSRPSLVEDKNGELFLFCYSSEGNENDLQQVQYARSSDKGETWSSWQSISDPAFDSRHISVAADKEGKIHVVWRAQVAEDEPTQIIYRSLIDDKWTVPQVVSPSQNYQFFPSVGATQSGGVYVSWMESLGSSGFPRENPFGGFGMVSFMKKEKFKSPVMLSEKSNLFYPNVSEEMEGQDFVPVFYAQQSDGKEFELSLRFLDSRL